MTTPLSRLKRTQERYFSAHHLLLSAAAHSLEVANSDDFVYEQSIVTAATMSALAVEAFVNAVGYLLFEDWSEFESAPTRAKVFLIAKELGLAIDKGRPPWQHVFELGRFRNDIVHAKPERILLVDYVERSDEVVAKRYDAPQSKLEKKLSLEAARQSHGACRTAFEQIINKMPEYLRLEIETDGWSTTHEPE